MKRYIKSLEPVNSNIFKVGDKIMINLLGIGVKTATCIQVLGRRNSICMFIFDEPIGKSSFLNIDNFIDNLYFKFPEDLQPKLREIRLLEASEVFSNCDRLSKWEDLLSWGAEYTKPQIDYLKFKSNIRCSNHWWLNNELDDGFIAITESGGSPYYTYSDYDQIGVRPIFILS